MDGSVHVILKDHIEGPKSKATSCAACRKAKVRYRPTIVSDQRASGLRVFVLGIQNVRRIRMYLSLAT
jgi:hypothetical protein